MYECKNCGRVLRYDVRSKGLVCDYCGSGFAVDSFPDKSYQKKEYEANVFLCSQCGGEIVTQSNDLTGMCAYCGTTQVFQVRTEMVQRPKWIIPFQNNKEYCKEQYTRAIRKAFYAPKELKDAKFIDNIRGVYMPYWTYVGEYNQKVLFHGNDSRKAKVTEAKITNQEYAISADYEAQFVSMQRDASSWYSDEISDNVRPFRLQSQSGFRPFNPAYLCGFFGETADVEKNSESTKDLQFGEKTASISNRFLNKKIEAMHYGITKGRFQIEKPTEEKLELSMLPVWFLSYRKGDRVSYSVMNGQTGQFAAEFPIDMTKFLLCTLGAAVILYLLLNLFWVMRPEDVAMIAAIGAMWAIRFIATDLTEITRKEYEIAPPNKRFGQKPTRVHRTFKYSMLIPYAFILGFFIAELTGHMERYPGSILFFLPAIMTIWATINAFKERKQIVQCRDVLAALRIKQLPLHLPAYISLGVALVIQITIPVADYPYYIAAFLCMAMTLLSIIGVVFSYNRMATRRLPQFDHTGGDDSAKTNGTPIFMGNGPVPSGMAAQPSAQAGRSAGSARTNRMMAWQIGLLSAVLLTTLFTFSVKASINRESVAPDYVDPESGYGLTIMDDARLFSYDEETSIMASMMEFLEYGNAVVATTNENPFVGVKELAIDYYDKAYGLKPGAIFLIDMDDREIFWYTEGDLYKDLSLQTAMAITDNVYTYAVDGDYAGCCEAAFEQATTVISGGKIANKMKYIGNALLAIMIALFLNYLYARKTSFIRPAVLVPEEIYESKKILRNVKETFVREVTFALPKRAVYGSTSWGNSYSSSSYSGRSSSSSSWSSSSSHSSSSHSSSSHSSSRSSSSSGHRGGGAGHRF